MEQYRYLSSGAKLAYVVLKDRLEYSLEALLLWHTIRVHEQLAAGKSGLRLGHY